MSLPSPRVQVAQLAGSVSYTLLVWAILALVTTVLPLIWAAVRQLCACRRWSTWLHEDTRWPLLVLLVWATPHNLSYMALLPVPGTASRYGALNHLLLWIALTVGVSAPGWRRWLRAWLGAGVVELALVNTAYWDSVYDANIEHMRQVRIDAADHVRTTFSSGERCAAADIGAIRYYVDRPIVDLCGLIDLGAGEWFLRGEYDRYVTHKGVTCLLMPGRVGAGDEGWFDLAGAMGFTDTPLFEMHEVAVFEIDRERWLRGYLPTSNYQATVAVYRLSMKAGAEE
jgi:hypothetical protein